MALKNIVGVDHAVVVVKELDRAAETWKRLGFTVSPRGTHSAKMGSGNYTIMLGSDYIELLGVLAETEHNAPTRAFLARRGDGIERIAFTAVDSAAGAAEIRAHGYAALGPTDFERPVTMPDGTLSAAKFSIISMADRGGAGRASDFRLPAQDAGDGLDSRIAAARQRREGSQTRAGGFARASQGRRTSGAHDRPRGRRRVRWRVRGAIRLGPRRFRFPDQGPVGPALSRRLAGGTSRTRRRRASCSQAGTSTRVKRLSARRGCGPPATAWLSLPPLPMARCSLLWRPDRFFVCGFAVRYHHGAAQCRALPKCERFLPGMN